MVIREDKLSLDKESQAILSQLSFGEAKKHLKKYCPSFHKVYIGGNHIALINTMTNERDLLLTE
jgi:hypothetical protein